MTREPRTPAPRISLRSVSLIVLLALALALAYPVTVLPAVIELGYGSTATVLAYVAGAVLGAAFTFNPRRS